MSMYFASFSISEEQDYSYLCRQKTKNDDEKNVVIISRDGDESDGWSPE